MEDIVSGNIKIAKFMEWRIDNSFPDKNRVWRLNNTVELETTFKFHTSWNMLIPVIEKLILIDKHYNFLYEWFDVYCVCGLEDAWEKVVKEIEKIN